MSDLLPTLTSSITPALYVGRVHHRRFRPRAHFLAYTVFMLHLDIDRPDAARRRFLSIGAWNLVSFHERDHGPAGDGSLPDRIRQLSRERGLGWDGSSVSLIALPRILGYVFNPLSVYFCRNADGRLAAIIYEVRNTFGGMHHYAADVADDTGTIHQEAAKAFYVSPFLPMDLRYRFHVRPPEERFSIAIEDRDRDGLVLSAAMSLTRRPLTDRGLWALALRLPLMTLKVVGGIGWEAMKLRLKGLPFTPPPRADTGAPRS